MSRGSYMPQKRQRLVVGFRSRRSRFSIRLIGRGSWGDVACSTLFGWRSVVDPSECIASVAAQWSYERGAASESTDGPFVQ